MLEQTGKKAIDPPMRGRWPFDGFPLRVSLQGRRFARAVYAWPQRGVAQQYREEVAQDSQHLKVFNDGTWWIDHSDDANPDMGRAVEHLLSDVFGGR